MLLLLILKNKGGHTNSENCNFQLWSKQKLILFETNHSDITPIIADSFSTRSCLVDIILWIIFFLSEFECCNFLNLYGRYILHHPKKLILNSEKSLNSVNFCSLRKQFSLNRLNRTCPPFHFFANNNFNDINPLVAIILILTGWGFFEVPFFLN